MSGNTRVLYVDDEPYLLDIGKLFLEQSGDFSVTTIGSATAALELLKEEKFDAIISDYQMPEMNGIQFLIEVRTHFGRIPFILFTGRGREEVVIQAINSGVNFYLQKGGEPESQFAELAHKIRNAVKQIRIEEALFESQNKATEIIEFLPDATFAIDTTGTVIAWNLAMERMTGVKPQEILNKDNFEYSIPFYHERRPILIDLVLKEDPDTVARYPYVKRDGNNLISEVFIPHMNNGKGAFLWFTASPLFNTHGTISGAIESIRDITERKLAEDALIESEKRYRAIIHSMQFGVVIIDAQTHSILDANNKALEMFGCSREVIVGSVCHQFICPAERGNCPVTDLGQMIDSSERILLNLKGEKISIIKSVVKTMLGGKEVLIESFVDITDRRVSENALRESEEKYRTLFKKMMKGVVYLDRDGQIVEANEPTKK